LKSLVAEHEAGAALEMILLTRAARAVIIQNRIEFETRYKHCGNLASSNDILVAISFDLRCDKRFH
jgi:hypothetical protein